MEQIAAAVDTETYRKLKAQKINDASLLLLSASDLVDMGITEKGPILLILNIANKLRTLEEDVSEAGSSTANQLSRQTFEADDQFRCNVLLPILDRGEIPMKNDLNAITRIACKAMEKRIFEGSSYPSTDEQEKTAKEIVALFPQLKCDRERPTDAPDEWLFFWRHSGFETGTHNGLIFHRIRNTIKKLPTTLRKFKRNRVDILSAVHSDIRARAEALQIMDRSDKFKVCKEMEACFPLHQMFLQEKKGVFEIVAVFPHLLNFNGLLINQTYARLFPNGEAQPDYRGVLAKCLLFCPEKFRHVEDEYLRALLRINEKLPTRGFRRKVEGTLTIDNTQSLVRWIMPSVDAISLYMSSIAELPFEPHIVCVANSMTSGPLYVFVEQNVYVEVKTSIHAIDTFFKCFSVFGINVPTKFVMLMDFLAIVLFKTLFISTRLTVNKLAASFKEAENAEM